MTEAELYRSLGELTRDRAQWEAQIPYVSQLLTHGSPKIQAKALWLLGEMGLRTPVPSGTRCPASPPSAKAPIRCCGNGR